MVLSVVVEVLEQHIVVFPAHPRRPEDRFGHQDVVDHQRFELERLGKSEVKTCSARERCKDRDNGEYVAYRPGSRVWEVNERNWFVVLDLEVELEVDCQSEDHCWNEK